MKKLLLFVLIALLALPVLAVAEPATPSPCPAPTTPPVIATPVGNAAESCTPIFRELNTYGSAKGSKAAMEIIDKLIKSFSEGLSPNAAKLGEYKISDYQVAIKALGEPRTFEDFAIEIEQESLGATKITRLGNSLPMEIELTRRNFDGLPWTARMLLAEPWYFHEGQVTAMQIGNGEAAHELSLPDGHKTIHITIK